MLQRQLQACWMLDEQQRLEAEDAMHRYLTTADAVKQSYQRTVPSSWLPPIKGLSF